MNDDNAPFEMDKCNNKKIVASKGAYHKSDSLMGQPFFFRPSLSLLISIDEQKQKNLSPVIQ